MNIEALENKIIEKLKGKLTDLLVDAFLKNHKILFLLILKVLFWFITKVDLRENIECVGAVFQNKKMEFAITLVTRSLRTKYSGAYELLDEVKSILTGFQIDGCSKMHLTKEGFLSENNGVWQYSIILNLLPQALNRRYE